MPTDALADHAPASNPSSISKIEPSKILDLVISKQTHYYSLWAVYTAVQFAAASFGFSQRLVPQAVALAVLAGFWAFNLGHLSFVLACLADLGRLKHALNAVATGNAAAYESAVRTTVSEISEARRLWRALPPTDSRFVYRMNIAVHLFIDLCASIALLARTDNPWIQHYLPDFLKAS
jgi:hypothetical protein